MMVMGRGSSGLTRTLKGFLAAGLSWACFRSWMDLWNICPVG